MTEYILWGATGQAKVLREALDHRGMRLAALVDNRHLPSPFSGVPLLHGRQGLLDWLGERSEMHNLQAAVAIGGDSGRDRVQLMDDLEQLGFGILTVFHPTAFVATDSQIGRGCQILAQSAVCTHARLGRGVIVNTASSVDHDCELEDGVHIGPGAHLAGEIHVGANSFIGAGAVILPRITIGEGALIGAGAVVTRDVGDGITVMGNPARPCVT